MNLLGLKKIIQTVEGRILLSGIVLFLLLSVFIFICYYIDGELANKISGMVITNIAVGRVPSLSFGYASNLSHLVVISTNVLVEMIMVTIIYSIFIFSFNNIIKVEFLENFFNKIEDYKIKHEKIFNKYGTLGLFLFVFIPFWMTGPIVGSIIGYLIGFKHSKTISIVFIATIIAVSIWGILLNELVVILNMIDTSLVWLFFVGLVVVVILFNFRKLFKG